MLYEVLNYLFGWDYVIWQNFSDSGIARVVVLPDGTVGYWRYKNTNVFDEIKNPKEVYWLTCRPDKYF